MTLLSYSLLFIAQFLYKPEIIKWKKPSWVYFVVFGWLDSLLLFMMQ